MSLDAWLRQLTETGRLRVSPPAGPTDGEPDAAAIAILKELDATARLDAPLDAPDLCAPSALWAATLLHRAAQCFVHRDVPGEAVADLLMRPCPMPPGPASCHSVDLVLRFLPDLFALARGLAENDPLVEGLINVGRAWPLSSVGMKGLGHIDPSPFIDHPSLRRTYADRIIDRDDVSRLDDPRALDAVREALGGFGHLAPAMQERVRERLEG